MKRLLLLALAVMVVSFPAIATDYDTPSPASMGWSDFPNAGGCYSVIVGGGVTSQSCTPIASFNDAYCPGLGAPYCP